MKKCHKCGCSDADPCISADFGPCWWVHEFGQLPLCSHCQEELKDIERPVRFQIRQARRKQGRVIMNRQGATLHINHPVSEWKAFRLFQMHTGIRLIRDVTGKNWTRKQLKEAGWLK